MQPGAHRGLTAVAAGPAEGGHERLLHDVGRVLRVLQGAHRDPPHPVPVPVDQLAERALVAGPVRGEQLRIASARRLTSGE